MSHVFPSAIILSEAELVARLLPHIAGYPWALDTIGDLWRMGAPLPNTPVGTPREKRIILPGQFQRWWDDVCKRQGVAVQAAEVLRG